MAEWRLYPPLLAHFRALGLHAVASLKDPRGRRIELDVVAFDALLEDVRIVEAKERASGALLAQCEDRLALGARVYAAAPAAEAARLEALAKDAPWLGLLVVENGGVRVLREAAPIPERAHPSRAAAFRRLVAGALAEGA